MVYAAIQLNQFPYDLITQSFNPAPLLESHSSRLTIKVQMLDTVLGILKWGAVGFVVTLFLMVVFEASRIHDDIPVPDFKRRHTKRTVIALSTFAGVLSGLVWLLVLCLD
jgi:hypothetical protein